MAIWETIGGEEEDWRGESLGVFGVIL